MSLDAAQASRLVKLLGMTSSTFDGEALAAIRKANDLIRSAGLTWADIITAAPEPARGTWREPADWIEAMMICLTTPNAPLTDWDRRFLVGISRQSCLTEKQQIQLDRIVEVCRLHARQAA